MRLPSFDPIIILSLKEADSRGLQNRGTFLNSGFFLESQGEFTKICDFCERGGADGGFL